MEDNCWKNFDFTPGRGVYLALTSDELYPVVEACLPVIPDNLESCSTSFSLPDEPVKIKAKLLQFLAFLSCWEPCAGYFPPNHPPFQPLYFHPLSLLS